MVDIDERKILEAFLEEVKELLETLNQRLLDLENSPEDSDVINEIFRLTHSIKSESALVGYKKISTLAHKMEDIFDFSILPVCPNSSFRMPKPLREMDKIIYPVCTLCRDHQRSGFVEGVKVGIRLKSEL